MMKHIINDVIIMYIFVAVAFLLGFIIGIQI
jgi:hypothetical protein